MYIKILPGSILFLLALTACQQNSPSIAPNGAGKPAFPAASPAVSVNSNPAPEVKAEYYNGTGKVTKINMEIGSVELDHEEIKELKMPAMRMEFYVADPSQLQGLKVGDRVDFVLEDKGGAEKIFSIKKAGTQKGEKR
ncbi:MAG TPA: copper-binding protein [Pyrinomonadaceae bacterium]|jgi:Cu/Ag efflux protein CusF